MKYDIIQSDHSAFIKKVGKNFRIYRASKNISLKDVAAAADLTYSTVSRFERGIIDSLSFKSVLKLLDAIGEFDQISHILNIKDIDNNDGRK